MIRFVGAVMFTLFLLGVTWSIIPLGEETLPHRVETLLDIPFVFATLLISLSLSVLAIGAIVAVALTSDTRPETQESSEDA
jgi:hypothetical protein